MFAPIEALRTALAGRYDIERELGQGGMATVFLARDVKHNRQVAIKVLRPDLADILGPERFLREIEIAANLNHPHILALFDSGNADGFLFYVMPMVEGATLRDRLAEGGAFPIADAVHVLREVVDALAYAHARGIVHRDIKPSNVMFNGRHVVVSDFGIAKAVSEASEGDLALTLTATGMALGTPAYMSPEQAVGEELDGRSDIYSVGAMAYELLTGRTPFEGPTAGALIAAQLAGEVPPIRALREDVPLDVERLVLRCLEKAPGDRWQTADEMLGYLQEMTPERITPTKARVVPRRWRLPKLKRNAALVGAGLFGAAVVVVAAFSLRPAGTPPTVVMQPAEQITFSGDVDYVAMASDGRTAAYVQAIGSGANRRDVLHIVDVGGSGGDVVAVEGGRVYEPSWSPDASTLMFYMRTPEGDRGIYEVPRLGGTPRRLVNTEDWPTQDVVHNYAGTEYLVGAGRWIFRGADPGSIRWPAPDSMTGEGVLLDVRDSPVEVSHGAGIALSPNGKWIAYHSRGTIHIAASDGSGVAGWWGGLDMRAGRMSRMVWSPQSDAVFYVLGRRDSPDPVLARMGVNPRTGVAGDVQDTVWNQRAIWRFDLAPESRSLLLSAGSQFTSFMLRQIQDGAVGTPEELLTRTSHLFLPQFSPDGRRLVYSEIVGYGRAAIRVVSLDGTPGQEFPLDGVPGGYGWSPDGTRILFGRQGRGQQLWLLDLTTERMDEIGIGRTPAEEHPAWSPDGRHIVYVSMGRDTVRLQTMSDGSVRHLPTGGFEVRDPLFSPGSDSLVVLSTRSSSGEVDRALWITSIGEARFRRMALGGIDRLLHWRDGYIYFAQNGAVRRVRPGGNSPELVARLDGCTEAPRDHGSWALSPDLETLVCTATSVRADLMVVQDFDPN